MFALSYLLSLFYGSVPAVRQSHKQITIFHTRSESEMVTLILGIHLETLETVQVVKGFCHAEWRYVQSIHVLEIAAFLQLHLQDYLIWINWHTLLLLYFKYALYKVRVLLTIGRAGVMGRNSIPWCIAA